MKDGEPALQRKSLGTKQLAADLAVFSDAMIGRVSGVATLLTTGRGFGEESKVETGRVVGGEVGSEEEVDWMRRKGERD